MVFDKIVNLRLYEELNSLFEKAIDYLEETDFSELAPGRHTILGDNIFALYQEYETKNVEDCLLEGHRKYIDIQYVLEGEEFIGVASSANQTVRKPYNADHDIAFFEGDFSRVKLKAGNFAIFFPHDLHMPCLKVEKPAMVRKVVIKVRVSK